MASSDLGVARAFARAVVRRRWKELRALLHPACEYTDHERRLKGVESVVAEVRKRRGTSSPPEGRWSWSAEVRSEGSAVRCAYTRKCSRRRLSTVEVHRLGIADGRVHSIEVLADASPESEEALEGVDPLDVPYDDGGAHQEEETA